MEKHCSQTETPREPTKWSSGHEPCACRVEDARDLPPRHADAMTAALMPGEKLRYLLYSPIWDGNQAPFGITAEPASHAVAVAHDRFLVSRYSHAEGATPTLRVIPFSDVLYVQLGSSFCLGWFAVLFAEQARAAYEPLLFRALSRDCFAAAICEYRRSSAEALSQSPATPGAAWKELWRQCSHSQAERIQELLFPGERPMGALRSSEQWVEQRGLWKRKWSCISCEGLLLGTNIGVFHVARETYERPVTWNIGMNVVHVPYAAIRSATIAQKVILGKRLHHVRLILARRNVATCLEVPFDESDIETAEGLVRHLTGGEASWSQSQVQAQSMYLRPSAQRSGHE